MKITKEKLKEAVDAISPFIEARSPLPILSHVRIESDGERVTFTASSIDAQINYWVDLACEKFSACVSAAALKKVAQFCNGDVDFSFKGQKATIQFDGSKTRIGTLDAAEFPTLQMSETIITEIEWKPLRDKINFALQFCSPNNVKPTLNCVQIISTGERLEIFGTNGLNMGLETVPHIGPEFGACIQADTARRMTGDFKTMILREEQIELRGDSSIALFKVAPYKPIKIDRIINAQLPNSGTVTRKTLLDAISFVGSFNDPGKLRGMVKIEAGDSNIVQLARGTNEANAPFAYTGDGFSVGAYQDDFIDFMKAIDGETFRIEFDQANLIDKQMRLIDGDRIIITMPART